MGVPQRPEYGLFMLFGFEHGFNVPLVEEGWEMSRKVVVAVGFKTLLRVPLSFLSGIS